MPPQLQPSIAVVCYCTGCGMTNQPGCINSRDHLVPFSRTGFRRSLRRFRRIQNYKLQLISSTYRGDNWRNGKRRSAAILTFCTLIRILESWSLLGGVKSSTGCYISFSGPKSLSEGDSTDSSDFWLHPFYHKLSYCHRRKCRVFC